MGWIKRRREHVKQSWLWTTPPVCIFAGAADNVTRTWLAVTNLRNMMVLQTGFDLPACFGRSVLDRLLPICPLFPNSDRSARYVLTRQWVGSINHSLTGGHAAWPLTASERNSYISERPIRRMDSSHPTYHSSTPRTLLSLMYDGMESGLAPIQLSEPGKLLDWSASVRARR